MDFCHIFTSRVSFERTRGDFEYSPADERRYSRLPSGLHWPGEGTTSQRQGKSPGRGGGGAEGAVSVLARGVRFDPHSVAKPTTRRPLQDQKLCKECTYCPLNSQENGSAPAHRFSPDGAGRVLSARVLRCRCQKSESVGRDPSSRCAHDHSFLSRQETRPQRMRLSVKTRVGRVFGNSPIGHGAEKAITTCLLEVGCLV